MEGAAVRNPRMGEVLDWFCPQALRDEVIHNIWGLHGDRNTDPCIPWRPQLDVKARKLKPYERRKLHKMKRQLSNQVNSH